MLGRARQFKLSTKACYNQALIAAAIEGHYQLIQYLAAAGADVNTTSSSVRTDNIDFKCTPLLIAARHGHKDCVETLIELGADVNIPNFYRATPLMLSLTGLKDDIHCAQLLIKSGADVNAVDLMGHTALIKVAQEGYVSAIKLLLESGADVNVVSQSNSPLIASSSSGHVNVVKILVESGASVNQTSNVGKSALMAASLRCNLSTIQTLIELGAEVNAAGKCGFTPLMLTASGGHMTCIEDLANCYLAKGAIFPHPVGSHQKRAAFNYSRIFKYCEKTPIGKARQLKCAQLLLASGADVNHTTRFADWTALMIAALDGDIDITQLLLDSGADVNTVTTRNGWSALVSAVVGGHYECSELLIECGADVNITICPVRLGWVHRKSVLGFAADVGNMEIIKLLLRRGVHYGGVWATTVTGPNIKKMLSAAGAFSLEDGDTDYSLQAQCREVVRQHLLRVSPPVNLFFKVAILFLPSPIQRYLLYNSTLD